LLTVFGFAVLVRRPALVAVPHARPARLGGVLSFRG